MEETQKDVREGGKEGGMEGWRDGGREGRKHVVPFPPVSMFKKLSTEANAFPPRARKAFRVMMTPKSAGTESKAQAERRRT
jgi:hypothetical protein